MEVKIGLDLGASRVKVSFLNSNNDYVNFNFPNRIYIGDSVGNSGFSVKYNGETTKVGSTNGTPNMTRLKVNYNHLEEILLSVGYKVRKELLAQSILIQQDKEEKKAKQDSEINLTINTLLPPKQFFTNGSDFKEKLLSLKTLQGQVNGEDITVNIKHVSVLCEGVVLIDLLNFSELSETINRTLLIDVGSSTIELIEVIKNNGEWEVGNVDTLDFGGAKMCKEIEKILLSKYKSPFSYDELERTMTYTFNQKEYDILKDADCIKALDGVVDEFRTRLDQFADHKQYRVILGGDGSELLYTNKKMKDFIPEATLLNKQIRVYGNSLGAARV